MLGTAKIFKLITKYLERYHCLNDQNDNHPQTVSGESPVTPLSTLLTLHYATILMLQMNKGEKITSGKSREK